MIFGITGALRKDELTNITLHDIETHGSLLLVKIPESESNKARSFTIATELYEIVREYQSLRPPTAPTDRFFLNYKNGVCTVHAVGKNRFGSMPREIATFLQLEDADQFTGHCFRRSSAGVLARLGGNMTTLKCHGDWDRNGGLGPGGYMEELDPIEVRPQMHGGPASSVSDSDDDDDGGFEEPEPMLQVFVSEAYIDEFAEEKPNVDPMMDPTGAASYSNDQSNSYEPPMKMFKLEPL